MPAIESDSYGSPEGVAALAGTWTTSGAWLDTNASAGTTATNPSLSTVVSWLDQLSDVLNTALKAYGFTVPLSQSNSLNAAAFLINALVGDLARYANQKGRFFSEKFQKSGNSVWETIVKDIYDWVALYASGLEQNGETRGGSTAYAIGTKQFDPQGNEVFPIFQRKGFDNTFIDWTGRG